MGGGRLLLASLPARACREHPGRLDCRRTETPTNPNQATRRTAAPTSASSSSSTIVRRTSHLWMTSGLRTLALLKALTPTLTHDVNTEDGTRAVSIFLRFASFFAALPARQRRTHARRPVCQSRALQQRAFATASRTHVFTCVMPPVRLLKNAFAHCTVDARSRRAASPCCAVVGCRARVESTCRRHMRALGRLSPPRKCDEQPTKRSTVRHGMP